MLGLNRGESVEFVLGHVDLLSLAQTDSVDGSRQPRGSVGVQGLVSRLSSSDRGTSGVDRVGESGLSSLSLLESLDDGELEGELDQVEGEVPDDVPHPNDTDPSTGDVVHVRETPITETGDDGGNELGQTEGKHKSDGRSFHPGEAMRSSDEDQCLRDNGDLEVNDHVQSSVVDTLVGIDTELAFEEVGVVDDDEEDDGGEGQVETVTDTVGEDFGQIP